MIRSIDIVQIRLANFHGFPVDEAVEEMLLLQRVVFQDIGIGLRLPVELFDK